MDIMMEFDDVVMTFDSHQVLQMLSSRDSAVQLEILNGINEILYEDDPKVDEIVNAGIVPVLVQLLTRDDAPQLQLEAARALRRIEAFGTYEHVRIVIESGAIPLFLTLLSSPVDAVKETAMWAIGEVSVNMPSANYVLSLNTLPILAQHITNTSTLSMLRATAWVLASVSLGDFDRVRPALPIISHLLSYAKDHMIIRRSLLAMWYLCDRDNYTCVQAVIDSGVTSSMVELLMHEDVAIQKLALSVLADIASCHADHSKHLLSLGILLPLSNLLKSPKKGIVEEVCRCISSIALNSQAQIQMILLHTDIFQTLISLLGNSNKKIKFSAAEALCDITSCAIPEQNQYLVNYGIMKMILPLLSPSHSDEQLILLALHILYALFENSPEGNKGYIAHIEQEEGVHQIASLISHSSYEVAERAFTFLESCGKIQYLPPVTFPHSSHVHYPFRVLLDHPAASPLSPPLPSYVSAPCILSHRRHFL